MIGKKTNESERALSLVLAMLLFLVLGYMIHGILSNVRVVEHNSGSRPDPSYNREVEARKAMLHTPCDGDPACNGTKR